MDGSHSLLIRSQQFGTQMPQGGHPPHHSTSLHERISVRHELIPARRSETQSYANIRNMYASQLEHRRLIKYTLARRPECILRDGEPARFDRELIHMAELGTDHPG